MQLMKKVRSALAFAAPSMAPSPHRRRRLRRRIIEGQWELRLSRFRWIQVSGLVVIGAIASFGIPDAGALTLARPLPTFDTVVLHCDPSQSDIPAAIPWTLPQICEAARVALERLARGQINEEVLKIPDWSHAADPTWPEKCLRQWPGQPIACEADLFRVLSAKAPFPTRVTLVMSEELLRDKSIGLVGIRLRTSSQFRCPAGNAPLHLEAGPITEISHPEDAREPSTKSEIPFHTTINTSVELCVRTDHGDKTLLEDKCMVMFAKWMRPIDINAINNASTRGQK